MPELNWKFHPALLVAFVAAWCVFGLVSFFPPAPPVASLLPVPLPLTHPKQTFGIPTHIAIPSIGVDTDIVPVGQDPDGRMGIPSRADLVGWYDQSARPGQEGSAVMAGHLDTTYTKQGVFFHLKDVHRGDDILITDTNGNHYRFNVLETAAYPENDAPRKRIFTSTGGVLLNLITCHGTWQGTTYSKRFVVYTQFFPGRQVAKTDELR